MYYPSNDALANIVKDENIVAKTTTATKNAYDLEFDYNSVLSTNPKIERVG